MQRLKTDEILIHFGVGRSLPTRNTENMSEPESAAPTIWEDLNAQSTLGTEGFAQALRDHVTGRNTVKEIPKEQRLLGRPTLKQLFNQTAKHKHNRDQLIAEAVYQHGYSQMEVAQYLDLHYSTISRLIHAHQTAK